MTEKVEKTGDERTQDRIIDNKFEVVLFVPTFLFFACIAFATVVLRLIVAFAIRIRGVARTLRNIRKRNPLTRE